MSDQCGSGTERPDWFGAYAPAEHVSDATGGIAYGGEKEVENVAAVGTESGKFIFDTDTVSEDTVRLVYDREQLEALHKLTGDLLENCVNPGSDRSGGDAE